MVARPRREILLALAVGAAGLLGAPAFTQAHGFQTTLSRGAITLPHGARRLGAVPASRELRATVALRPRNPRALAAYAAAVSTPGSPEYRHYLTVAGFAARFAPTASERAIVRAGLRSDGLLVGGTSPNGLSITVRGSSRVTADTFSTEIAQYALPGGRTVQAPIRTPRLAGRAGALVQGIVGLDTVAPTASLLVDRTTHRPVSDALTARSTTPASTGAGPQPCAAAAAQASRSGALTSNQIAARYGLSNYYTAGDEGRGVTIALFELESFNASDIAGYQACLGTSATVETEAVNGGAGTGAGSGEAAMDVEDLIGLAPHATIRVYEGPPSGYGAYATYSAIVADDAAQVISTSWGACEAEVGVVDAQAENVLFQEAAAQGQTVIAAAGDAGADDCGNGTQSVDDPGSQPWVTAVGGSSVHGASDTVWDNPLGAGGGGVSSLWPRPSWQTSVVAQSGVSCGSAGTSCREVPDVALDADPSTGYVSYFEGAWRTVGGTSVSAPTLAALAALADASPACASHPLGFLDPALYAHAADLADITFGSNSFGGVLGYAAGVGYDMASGLGAPTAALGPALCGDSLSLATPAAQSWSTSRAVSLTPSASSAKGAAIAFTASGLPVGLSLNASTGAITGTPTAAGRFTITLTAIDADGASASATFAATVTAAVVPTEKPGGATRSRRSALTIAGRTHIHGRVGRSLRVRLHVRGARGSEVHYLAVGLPRGLRIGRRSGIVSGTPRSAGHSMATIRVAAASGVAVDTRVAVTVRRRPRVVHAHSHERHAGRHPRR